MSQNQNPAHSQVRAQVRMDWGEQGAAAVAAGADYAVIVDILSFTTTVTVALELGAEVYPYRWRDESAARFARQHNATLAVGRMKATTAADKDAAAASTASESAVGTGPRVSLSPASIRAARDLKRLVLPSPNGSTLAAQLAGRATNVVGACLRNRTAVSRWLCSRLDRAHPVIAVIAAGERWANGSLRPAVEDLWGAGAVVAALQENGATAVSSEAAVAAAAFRAVEGDLAVALADCASGRELISAGFGDDVRVAAELDVSTVVPILRAGRFVAADVRS